MGVGNGTKLLGRVGAATVLTGLLLFDFVESLAKHALAERL